MTTASNIPSQSLPVIGPDGRISMVWFQFLLMLFSRTGGTKGASADDWTAAAFEGVPQTDLGPVYGLIHAVEALAAQAMAATAQRPDERGEAGDGATVAHLQARIADLEARLEAMGTPLAPPAGYAPASISGVVRQIPYY